MGVGVGGVIIIMIIILNIVIIIIKEVKQVHSRWFNHKTLIFLHFVFLIRLLKGKGSMRKREN